MHFLEIAQNWVCLDVRQQKKIICMRRDRNKKLIRFLKVDDIKKYWAFKVKTISKCAYVSTNMCIFIYWTVYYFNNLNIKYWRNTENWVQRLQFGILHQQINGESSFPSQYDGELHYGQMHLQSMPKLCYLLG